MDNFSFIVGIKMMFFQCYVSLPEGIYPYHINIFSKRSPNTYIRLHAATPQDAEPLEPWKMMGNTSPNYHPGNMFCIFFRQNFFAFYGPIILYPDVPWSKLGKKSPTGDDSYRSMGTLSGWFYNGTQSSKSAHFSVDTMVICGTNYFRTPVY